MIITYQKRCKGWHGKWVSKDDTLDVTRSAARHEIEREVALPPEDSDLYPKQEDEQLNE